VRAAQHALEAVGLGRPFLPPQTIKTRVGELNYEAGFPTKDTSQQLYDEIDFQRACQAYMWSFPAMSFVSIKAGLVRDVLG
jgi:hypothetical protein